MEEIRQLRTRAADLGTRLAQAEARLAHKAAAHDAEVSRAAALEGRLHYERAAAAAFREQSTRALDAALSQRTCVVCASHAVPRRDHRASPLAGPSSPSPYAHPSGSAHHPASRPSSTAGHALSGPAKPTSATASSHSLAQTSSSHPNASPDVVLQRPVTSLPQTQAHTQHTQSITPDPIAALNTAHRQQIATLRGFEGFLDDRIASGRALIATMS